MICKFGVSLSLMPCLINSAFRFNVFKVYCIVCSIIILFLLYFYFTYSIILAFSCVLCAFVLMPGSTVSEIFGNAKLRTRLKNKIEGEIVVVQKGVLQ